MTSPVRKAKSVQLSPKLKPYPPHVPGSKLELKRAICLLGNRTKANLTSKSYQELVALVGSYPSA